MIKSNLSDTVCLTCVLVLKVALEYLDCPVPPGTMGLSQLYLIIEVICFLPILCLSVPSLTKPKYLGSYVGT